MVVATLFQVDGQCNMVNYNIGSTHCNTVDENYIILL